MLQALISFEGVPMKSSTSFGDDAAAKELLDEIRGALIASNAEIDPYSHDASYEMVQKACEVYSRDFPDNAGLSDLDLFFNLLINVTNENRRDKIKHSSLNEELKKELLQALSDTEQKEYANESSNGKYGMFSSRYTSFKRKNSVSEDDAKKIVRLFADLADAQTADEKLSLVEAVFKDPIKGFQNGYASQFLHCIDPEVFPIINGHEGRESLYVLLGVEGIPSDSGRNDLTRYVEFAKKIQEYRDDPTNGFKFKNYRVFDIQEAKLPKMRESKHISAEIRAKATDAYEEGARRIRYLSEYITRNREARIKCLEIMGFRCAVCGIDLGEKYGTRPIVEVHHLELLSNSKSNHLVDPEKDLVPVCPNCHAVIHSKGGRECYTPNEVRAMLGLEPLESY